MKAILLMTLACACTLASADYTYSGKWKNNNKTFGSLTVKIRPNGDFVGSIRDDFQRKTFTVFGTVRNRQVSGTVRFGAQSWTMTGSGTYGVRALDWTVRIGGSSFRFLGSK